MLSFISSLPPRQFNIDCFLYVYISVCVCVCLFVYLYNFLTVEYMFELGAAVKYAG